MRYVKWTFLILFWALVLAGLHYTLPRWDVVRVNDTYSRIEASADFPLFWSQARDPAMQREVFFIQTTTPSGRPMVYRNEDTGWGWPPFFKFDTANLQAEAADQRSTAQEPAWVAIKHYGWRNELMSIYPNAITIKPVSGPDVRVIPWISIVILVTLGAIWWALRVRWNRFWESRVDPVIDSVAERF